MSFDMQRKTKSKKGKTIFWTVLILFIGGAGWLTWTNWYTVPGAIDQAKTSQDSAALCKPFADMGIPCTVKWVESDEPRGTLISQSRAQGSGGLPIVMNDAITLKYSKGVAKSEMPDVVGMDAKKAKKALYDAGLILKETTIEDNADSKENEVISASIEAGTEVKAGTEVSIVVASGGTEVPDFTGLTKKEAQKLAKDNELKVTFTEEVSEEAAGTVISQSQDAGDNSTTIKNENTIALVLAKSAEVKTIAIPDVVGKDSATAQAELTKAGFRNVETVIVKNNEVTSSQVTQTVPLAGQQGTTDGLVVIIYSEPVG